MTPAAATVPVHEGAPAAVVAVVEGLRRGGLPVSTSETIDAVRALAEIDLARREQVKVALRATLVKDPTRNVLFERAFESVFPRPARPRTASAKTEGEGSDLEDSLLSALHDNDREAIDAALEEAIERFGGTTDDGRSAGHHLNRTLRRMNVPDLYRRYLDQAEGATEMDRAIRSAEASLAIDQMKRRMEELISGKIRESEFSFQQLEDPEDRPLLQAGPDELAAMRLAMRPLARRLATRLGNRRRRGTSGLDMRRTIRASMGTGGVPVKPILRRRRPTKPELVVLCDVSGSTAQFAPFTLTLLHAVHQEFNRVRSFVFIDGIVEITDILASSPGVLDPHHLLARQGLIAQDGRSDYKRAFTTFMSKWGDAVTAKTTVIIAGDTRSHRRDSALTEIAILKHRARRLYWLNPEPRHEWDTLDSCASEYADHCTQAFEVSTIRHLISAVTQIV